MKQSTCVGVGECRQQPGILPGCAPAAPCPPVPPSPSTPPELSRTAPQHLQGWCWTQDGCSCQSPAGLEHRRARCWRASLGFGPKGQLHRRSHAGEPGEACDGQRAAGKMEGSTAETEWKTLRSTDSRRWIFARAVWRKAASQLQRTGEKMKQRRTGRWRRGHDTD